LSPRLWLSRLSFFSISGAAPSPTAGRAAIHPARGRRASAHLAALSNLHLRRSSAAPTIPLSPANGSLFSGAGTPPTPNPKIHCFLHRLRCGQPRRRWLRGASLPGSHREEGGRKSREGDNVSTNLDTPIQW
jgi:hypothetical protein